MKGLSKSLALRAYPGTRLYLGLLALLGLMGLPAPSQAAGPEDCSTCHTAADWKEINYSAADHRATGFALEAGHAKLACARCHSDLHTLKISAQCASCHQDPHAGRLGASCASCHETTRFDTGAGVQAHGRTRFPLTGRHALVTCAQCHLRRSDLRYASAPSACASCHMKDILRTQGTVADHTVGSSPAHCERCHGFASWRRAALPDHDRCFPISRGSHATIRCEGCHTKAVGRVVKLCQSFSAQCSNCHHCGDMDRKHQEKQIAGYQCAERKCYECHPDGKGEGD